MPLLRRHTLTAGAGLLAAGGGLAGLGWYAGANPSSPSRGIYTGNDGNTTATGRLVNRTGMELLARVVAGDPARNAVIAPGTVLGALGMAAGATSEHSRARLAAALISDSGGEIDLDVLVERLGSLDRAVTAPSDGTELTTGAALLIARDANPNAGYLATLEGALGARARSVDFTAQATADDLNQWISERTGGLIPAVVSSFDPLTVLTLATAVHFKGRWLYAFDSRRTYDGRFRTAAGPDVRMPMMESDELTLPYLRLGALHALRLPYRGDAFEMVIVLPEAKGDTSIARWTAAGPLEDWRTILDPASYASVKVVVTLPRHQIETSVDLRATLATSTAFAPLMASGVRMGRLTDRHVAVGSVLHKALVRMDEVGTVAAAATVMELQQMSALPPRIHFAVDRPHAFAIRHVPTGAVVFAGHVAEPRPAPRAAA